MCLESMYWKTNIKNWVRSMRQGLSWENRIPAGIEKRRFSIFEWERRSSSDSDANNKKTRLCYIIWRIVYFLLCLTAKSFTFCDKIRHEKRYYYNYLTFWTCWTQLVYATVFVVYSVLTYWRNRQRFSSTHGHGTSTSRCRPVSTPNSTDQNPARDSGSWNRQSLMEMEAQPTGVSAVVNPDPGNPGDSAQTDKIKCPSVESVIWVLFHIQLNLTVFVTICFSFGYPKELGGKSFINHGGNAILALIDLFLVALPVRFVQVLYPALFAFLYTIYSIIWAVARGGYPKEGKSYIYHVLNWSEKPWFALGTTLVSLIIIIIFQFMLWAIKWGFKHKLLPFLCRCRT